MHRIQSLRAEQSRAEQPNCRINIVGQMDNTIDHTFESANRVYGTDGISPTMNTCGGGGLEPKIMEVKKIGNIYPQNEHQSGNVYDKDGASPTLQSGVHSYGIPFVVDKNPVLLGGVGEENEFGKQYRQGNRVYDSDGVAMCLNSQPVGNTGGNSYLYVEKKCVAMRGRNSEDPTDRTPGIELEQTLEINEKGLCNTLTSVQKDNLVLEKSKINNPLAIELGDPDFYNFLYDIDGEIYLIRIRKLTERECGRLMGFLESDIDAMCSVNSKTQVYKECGNSIVVPVLMALFSQMGIDGVPKWNDLSDDERYELLYRKNSGRYIQCT